MSAILGIYHLDGKPVAQEDVERMSEILAHRGPDGSKIWFNENLGLGHRMLWTTPESLREVLPFATADGSFVITADARIDNRDELIRILDLRNRPAETISDSELIVSSYEKWGEQCPEKLLGDFAFAIWDARRQSLFCARDPFGVKPFYYYSSDSLFVFATEIKGLLCVPGIPRQLNEVRVGDFFAGLFEQKDITFYKGILRLPPAHSLTIPRDGMRLRQYWFLDSSRELRLNSNDEFAEAFREIFTEAVKCRMRSAFPVGSMLSGGLDSSSITCVARQISRQEGTQPFPTFSAVFDHVRQCDERQFIGQVIAAGDIDPHFFHADSESPLGELEAVLWHLDEVNFAANLYLNWGCYEQAKRKGVRVILDGYDGDTTVSHGTMYPDELARAKRWFTLTREITGFTRKLNFSTRKMLWNYYWKYGLDPKIPTRIKTGSAQRLWLTLQKRLPFLQQQLSPSSLGKLNKDFIKRIGLRERRKSLWEIYPGRPETERERHRIALEWGVLPAGLEVVDKAAGRFSLDVRLPFFDKRLIEFCLSLPPDQKMHHGWTRIVMRRAMQGILPKAVQWRPGKTDLSPGIEYGLMKFERTRMEQLFNNPEAIERVVDTTTLRGTYQRLLDQGATNDDLSTIWRTVSLDAWLKSTALTIQDNDNGVAQYAKAS